MYSWRLRIKQVVSFKSCKNVYLETTLLKGERKKFSKT